MLEDGVDGVGEERGVVHDGVELLGLLRGEEALALVRAAVGGVLVRGRRGRLGRDDVERAEEAAGEEVVRLRLLRGVGLARRLEPQAERRVAVLLGDLS